MPKSYLDSLRKNRDGKYIMPYHVGWNDQLWTHQASEFVITDGLESQIYKIGAAIGQRCAELWRNVDMVTRNYAGTRIVKLVIDAANAIWIKMKDDEERATRLTIKERYHAIDTTSIDHPEVFMDLISDFLLSMIKKNIPIYTNLELPYFHSPSHAEMFDVSKIVSSIQEIGEYKFVFDKCVFLEGRIGFDGKQLSIANGASENGAMYLRLNKLSQLRDVTARRNLKLDEARHGKYRVVAAAKIQEGKLSVNLVDVYESPHDVPIAAMRGYVGSEYLFRVLGTSNEGIDAAYCWDIIFSLCETLRKARIADSIVHKDDIVSLLSVALGITRQRARKALEILTFRLGARTRDGVWSRPIVPIDRTYMSLVYAAVASITPVRQIHHIIGNLNLSSSRGGEFERSCV